MKSGDILHVVWRTPALVVSSVPSAGVGKFFVRTGVPHASAVAAPAPRIGVCSAATSTYRHDNRVQLCRYAASALSAFAAPIPTGTISQQPDLALPAAAPAPPAPKAATLEKIELAIDSLQDYDLVKPIPVLIESLGDKVFLAEAPDLNLSTTGNSVGTAFLLLKEQILANYENCHSKKGPDPQRAQQLAAFEQFIGKSRRHWF
jgi:hypothetical protein